jgi:hypothetical protein
LLLLRICLALLFLLNRLALLLLLRRSLALLLICLTLLLLRNLLIAHRRCRWGPHVAIGRQRLVSCNTGRTAVIDVGKLSPVGAGSAFVLNLCAHGRGMLLAQSRQFRGSGTHLHTTRSAVEAYAGAAPVVSTN